VVQFSSSGPSALRHTTTPIRLPAAFRKSPTASGEGVHSLLWLYFGLSFSYAHLPLAVVHHSLGSLFNYIGALLLGAALLKLPLLRFRKAEVLALFGSFVILVTALLGQTVNAMLTAFRGAGPDLLLRSALTLWSVMLPLVAVVLITRLARLASFTFRHMADATRFAMYFLLIYLTIEILGATFQIEPFAAVVGLVSKYLNYRDDLDMLGGRIRGFSNEPSYLSVVVIFMFTVMLIDQRVSNLKRYTLLLTILILSSASLSKNILGGLAILIILHAFYFRRLILPLSVALAALIGLFYLGLSQNEAISLQYEEFGVDISTLTRMGSWVAAWNGFMASPLFGNGLGLAGKLIVPYYPDWFYASPEATQWEAAAMQFGAPVFSNVFRTLFELGLFGIAFVAYVLHALIRLSNRRSLLAHDNAMLLAAFLVSYGMVDVLTFWPLYVALAIRRQPEDVR